MKAYLHRIKFLAVLAFLITGLAACNEKNEPAHPNEHVNNWIEANMQFWYYWNTELPAETDKTLDPEEYFNSLLSTSDRFSWIQENFTELVNSLRGVSKEAGYEIKLYRVSAESTDVIAQVLYVKPGSPAETGGLRRGDLIIGMNGQNFTIDNYSALLAQIGENHSIAYKPLDVEQQQHGEIKTMSLTPVEYAENPNFFHKVVVAGDRKIGYYVYNLFSSGPTSLGNEYNSEMDAIFASFQAAGITDLVLDLRFNSGGAELAARNLASLIGRGANASRTFAKRQYNGPVTEEIKKESGNDIFSVLFLTKSQNVGDQLTGGRVYILTGSRTASASELVINGLRPYMDVFLVGARTVGKNVGSISLYDETDPANTWGIQPIVTKSFNSLDQSDYDTGFTPQIPDDDNSRLVYPLGDPRERLLKKALDQILGTTTIGKTGPSRDPVFLEEVGNSLDLKRRSGVLVVDLPRVAR